VWRQDSQGISVHGACNAKWPLPDARRHQHWATHGDRPGLFDAGKLETWPILRGSKT